MTFLRCLLIVAVALCATVPSQAQSLLGNCYKIIRSFAGKPLPRAMVEGVATGGTAALVEQYFKEKPASPPDQRQFVTQHDLDRLIDIFNRSGRTECELRRDLENVFQPTDYPAPPGYSAEAFCRVTGMVGTAHAATPQEALEAAVDNCKQNGGIPECCRRGARLLK
jgi:hypothetical protein